MNCTVKSDVRALQLNQGKVMRQRTGRWMLATKKQKNSPGPKLDPKNAKMENFFAKQNSNGPYQ